jgi:hypothetical protein
VTQIYSCCLYEDGDNSRDSRIVIVINKTGFPDEYCGPETDLKSLLKGYRGFCGPRLKQGFRIFEAPTGSPVSEPWRRRGAWSCTRAS